MISLLREAEINIEVSFKSMKMADDSNSMNVDFLYKAMLERDPSKRRVKPVQRHMLQMEFAGLEDSSDDSDFEVNKHHDSDGSDDLGSDEDDDENDDDDNDDEDDDEGTSDGSGDDDEHGGVSDDFEMQGSESQPPQLENISAMSAMEDVQVISASYKPFRVLVCTVCLGDSSEETNEVVECDGCAVTVHEGCYGVSETQSVASTVSSASTEPWFCDPCKAGVKPVCDLCPNSGGIHKETDSGRWVHMVCALYVPGVAFADVDKLSPVTLFEMPYAKWGAKECSLCEDERFSRTGVCIGCDAGMCRNYFHVTCAQREGLLSEANPDEEIADPFYAYCKQHADKNMRRNKRRNFLAVQSAIKKAAETPKTDSKEQARVTRKLAGHRDKYKEMKCDRKPSWVPTEKVVRMLSSSASAMRSLFKKADLMGIQQQVSSHSISHKDIGKKWHVPAAFSTQFVEYFIDRNSRISNMRDQKGALIKQHHKLKGQETLYRSQYDKLNNDVEKLRRNNQEHRDSGKRLWAVLHSLGHKQKELPVVLRAPLKRSKRSHSSDDSFKRDPLTSPPPVIHTCGTCKKSHDQHLLTRCDKCHLYYHLGCLDPPLTRMPKKTKQFGWQCSQCSHSDSDNAEHKNVNAPRRLREISSLREPNKYNPFVTVSGLQTRTLKAERRNKPRQGHRTLNQRRNTSIKKARLTAQKRLMKTPSLPGTSKRPSAYDSERRSPSQRPQRDYNSVCVVCNETDDSTASVRCDGCGLFYHLLCLDPPAKRSPKVHGYSWLCVACDHLHSSSDDEKKRSPPAVAEAGKASPTRSKRLHKPSQKSLCLEEVASLLNKRPSKPRSKVSTARVSKTKRRPKRSIFGTSRKRRIGSVKKPDVKKLIISVDKSEGRFGAESSLPEPVMPELEQESIDSGSRVSEGVSPRWSPMSDESENAMLLRRETPPPPTLTPETTQDGGDAR